MDCSQEFVLLDRDLSLQSEFRHAQDPIHGGADLMADAGRKPAFCPRCQLRLFFGSLQLFELAQVRGKPRDTHDLSFLVPEQGRAVKKGSIAPIAPPEPVSRPPVLFGSGVASCKAGKNSLPI